MAAARGGEFQPRGPSPRRSRGWGALTLLEQHDAGEAVVEVPEVDAAHAALVVELAVDVKGLVGLDLDGPDALAGDGALAGALAAAAGPDAAGAALVERRVEAVGPRGAVAVAVAVVVAQQVVAPRVLAAPQLQRLVDRREQVLGQVRGQRDDGVEVRARVLGVEPPEEVAAGGARGGPRWSVTPLPPTGSIRGGGSLTAQSQRGRRRRRPWRIVGGGGGGVAGLAGGRRGCWPVFYSCTRVLSMRWAARLREAPAFVGARIGDDGDAEARNVGGVEVSDRADKISRAAKPDESTPPPRVEPVQAVTMPSKRRLSAHSTSIPTTHGLTRAPANHRARASNHSSFTSQQASTYHPSSNAPLLSLSVR